MVKKQILKESGLLPLWRLNDGQPPEEDLFSAHIEKASEASSDAIGHSATLPERKSMIQKKNTAPDWERLENEVSHCTKCILSATRTKTVFGVGDRHPDWLFVGEGPGAQEDKRGEPFVGQAGRLLDAILMNLGLSRHKKVYITNAVKCRPPENRKPYPDEMATCFPYLEQQIQWLSPKIIVALGATGAQTLLKTETKIGALRGKVHYYEDIPLIATYHPAYLLRSPMEKSKVWNDLVLALRTLEQRNP